MAAGNVADGADHDGVRQTIGKRKAQGADGNLRRSVEILVGADCSDSEENQNECADKFRQEFLRQTIQEVSPRAWKPKSRPTLCLFIAGRFYWIDPGQSKNERGAPGTRMSSCARGRRLQRSQVRLPARASGGGRV